MCMTFQLDKTPFLALELPRFLTFDMDQLAKHRRHHLKKRLKISKIANFESDTFSASEDIALQVAKFYRRLYGGGGGEGSWRDLIAPESHILNLNPRRILNRLV